jgi:hypothetical protein
VVCCFARLAVEEVPAFLPEITVHKAVQRPGPMTLYIDADAALVRQTHQYGIPRMTDTAGHAVSRCAQQSRGFAVGGRYPRHGTQLLKGQGSQHCPGHHKLPTPVARPEVADTLPVLVAKAINPGVERIVM